jgi:alpha-amylase
MKNISLTFKIHYPVRLKKYRFFDIGHDDYYYDDFENERIIRKAADEYLLPTNAVLLDLLKKYKGQFKVAFAISGTAIDLFKRYGPEVIESFQRLSATGCVEFLGETYAHSLASLKDKEEFGRQVEAHANAMEELFGQRPRVFKNTGLIYSDNIGKIIAEMGFKAVLTEGARHILRSKSHNHLYCNPINPNLKVLLKNQQLSEEIAFRLANPDWTGWPTTANNYLSTLNRIPDDENLVNLFMDYELVGKGQKKGTGIFNFLKSFPQALFEMTDYIFMTPSEIACYNQPAALLNVPDAISEVPYERDLSLFQGNELQREALGKLYELTEKIGRCRDHNLLKDWQYLQTSDHFRYMFGKQLPDVDQHEESNPYDNFYEAFMNYMNVLNDFSIRINHSITSINSDFVLKNYHQKVAI